MVIPSNNTATLQNVLDGTTTHKCQQVSASHFVTHWKEMLPPPDKTISAHKFLWISASHFMTLWTEQVAKKLSRHPTTRQWRMVFQVPTLLFMLWRKGGSKNPPVPEECQRDQPILLSICEVELEELSGHEREQHQNRRQLPIPSPLQTNEEILRNTR